MSVIKDLSQPNHLCLWEASGMAYGSQGSQMPIETSSRIYDSEYIAFGKQRWCWRHNQQYNAWLLDTWKVSGPDFTGNLFPIALLISLFNISNDQEVVVVEQLSAECTSYRRGCFNRKKA